MESKKSNVFSMRLKVARKAKKLSQERLGILAGIDEASASARMNQYETGKYAPDLLTAIKISAEQEEMMVEATFPDNLMYYLKLNNSFLVDKIDDDRRIQT